MRNNRLPTLCTALATLVLHSCSPAPAYAAAPLTLRYTSKAESTSPYQTTIWQGETVDLQCTLTSYGSPLTLAPDAAASLWYQTNGMASAWWQGPATATTNGILTAHWSPSLDVGASSYTYFIGVGDSATNTLYRSYGIIRMGKSPGYVPNALTLPRQSLDFATLDIANAPWATPEEVAAGDSATSNYVDSVTLALETSISNVWPTMVVTNYTYRPSELIVNYEFVAYWWDAYMSEHDITIMSDDVYRVATAEEWEAIMDKGVYTRELTLLPADAFGASMFDKPLITFASPYVAGAFASPDSGIAGHRSFWPLGYTSGDTLLSMSMDGGDVVNPDVFSVTDTVVTGSTLGTAPTEYALKSDLAATQLILTDHIDSPEAHAALIAPLATTNWVNSLRGIHADIASNIVYHIVVSNGHWLIKEVQ